MVYEIIYNGAWAWIGTISLLILTFQDLRTMHINDRKNLIMLGLSISLVGIYHPPLWYMLFIIGFNFGFLYLVRKMNLLADGDTSALGWIMLGFGIMGVTPLIFFLLWIAIFSALGIGVKLLTKTQIERFPYYPIITAAFIINAAWFGIF